MDFKQLRSFIAVADCGSFTQAAARLYTSQPTISAHIRQLEEELQQRLFLRTTKSLSITPRGQELYDYAAQMLAMHDQLLATWQQQAQILSISASTIPSACLLPELLPRFQAAHPDTTFDIHQSDSAGAIRALQRGQCDLALAGMDAGGEGLRFTPLCRDAVVLIAPNTAEFLEIAQENMDVRALLQRHALLLREEGSGSQRSMEAYLKTLGLELGELRVIARLNDLESIKNLVAAGLGLSIVSSRSVVRERERGDLLVFPLPGAAERTFYLVQREHDLLRPAARQFFDFAARFYQI